MITTSYACDGCGRKLKGDSLASALEFSVEAKRQDIYCPERCQSRAVEFWDISTPVFTRILSDADSAISNYRRKFFSSNTLKAVPFQEREREVV